MKYKQFKHLKGVERSRDGFYTRVYTPGGSWLAPSCDCHEGECYTKQCDQVYRASYRKPENDKTDAT